MKGTRRVDLPAADRQEPRARRCRCASKDATRPARAGPISSSPPMAAWRSSPRTERRSTAARRSIGRCCRSAGRSSGRTPRARSGRDSGYAASFRRSTSTTGSRCCRAGPANESGRPKSGAALRGRRSRRAAIRCDGDAIHRSQAAHARNAAGMDVRHRRPRRSPAPRTGRRQARARRTAGSWRGSRGFAVPGRGSAASWRAPKRRRGRSRNRHAPAQSLAGNRPRGRRAVSRRSAISAGSSSSRSQRGADWRVDKLVLANDAGRLEANGAWRVAGPRAANEARRRPRRAGFRRVPGALRLCRRRERRGDADRRATRVVRRAARVRLQHAQRNVPDPCGSGPVHQARTGSGQAPRRALAAGAAAARDARLQRRVQRRIRVRRNHRQRADRGRRDVDVRPEARRAGRQGRHLGRDRPREGNAAARRARAAGVVVQRFGRCGAAVPRESARRRRRRRRLAVRADAAPGSGREDVPLRVHGDRRLVGSGGRERAAATASVAPGSRRRCPSPRGDR